MGIERPGYPVVYVRGYAATMGEIEDTVATPYMGFNLGSTKLRQDYDGEVVPFVFESPLLRLIKDEGYDDVYRHGGFPAPGERVPPRSVWIFRYYDRASEDLGQGKRLDLPTYAADLRKFVLRIRDHVCGDDAAERAKFRVYLVAHSMGGLVVRCYLQNVCVNGTGDAVRDAELELPGDALVDKAFTYGTPHNGIDVMGMNAPDLGPLDVLRFGVFDRDRMREYLDLLGSDGRPRPDLRGRVDSLDGRFPAERFFCFAGTNWRDYQAFAGLSKKVTGPMSDGLVMMRNATVDRAPRAFAFRSHSGHYGIVNSEEGYQNLRRFLFGQVRVDVRLVADEITLPPPIQTLVNEGREVRASYNVESRATVRGLVSVALSERRVSQQSAIRRTEEQLLAEHRPVYLFTGYLHRGGKTDARDTALVFSVRLGIEVPIYEVDRKFWFDDHIEGGRVFDENVTLAVRGPAEKRTVKYGLETEQGAGVATRPPRKIPLAGGGTRYEIDLGFQEGAGHPPRPGFRGRLLLDTTPWNH